jgi:hypothetical protein
LRTHSSLGGDDLYKARHVPLGQITEKTMCCARRIDRYLKNFEVLVKAPDSSVRRCYSRVE